MSLAMSLQCCWRRLGLLLWQKAVRPAIRPGSLLYLSLIHISEPTRPEPSSYAVFCHKSNPSRRQQHCSDKANDIEMSQFARMWAEGRSDQVIR